MTLPEHVQVADFGIRGVHLAYELLERGYETTILVDATLRGGEPGTVYLLEPDLDGLDGLGDGGTDLADAHGMDPRAVFGLLARLGGTPGRVRRGSSSKTPNCSCLQEETLSRHPEACPVEIGERSTHTPS